MNVRDIEQRFPKEAATLVVVGKLRKDGASDFQGVYNHCLAVALATEIMRAGLGLSREVTAAAVLHDIKKRFEKRPKDFLVEEANKLEAVWAEIAEDLRCATAPLTEDNAAEKNTLRGRVVCLADSWTLHDQIVGLQERREGSEKRWPQLDWEFFMEWGHALEIEIWHELKRRGVVTGRGSDLLLGWVLSQIEK